MAATITIFRAFMTSSFNKLADWDSDTVKCSLHTSTMSPAQDTWDFFNDLTNELAASGNYSSGGTTISPCSFLTGTSKHTAIDGADAAWTNLTMSSAARYGAVTDTTPGTSATNPLMCWVDFGADQTVSGANFTIQWAAGGIVDFSVA
jgi:hypothetical protein